MRALSPDSRVPLASSSAILQPDDWHLCSELAEFTALLTTLVKLTSSSTGRNGIPKFEIGNICLDPGEIDHMELPSHPEPPLAMAAVCPPVSEEPGYPLLKSLP